MDIRPAYPLKSAAAILATLKKMRRPNGPTAEWIAAYCVCLLSTFIVYMFCTYSPYDNDYDDAPTSSSPRSLGRLAEPVGDGDGKRRAVDFHRSTGGDDSHDNGQSYDCMSTRTKYKYNALFVFCSFTPKIAFLVLLCVFYPQR